LSAKAFALGRYDPNGRLVYAGRAGNGINTAELKRLWHRLQPLATDKMPLRCRRRAAAASARPWC
jgi:ATP-dependent DNA ligase